MIDRNMLNEGSTFASGDDLVYHQITFGTTGKGMSAITREIAEREGVSL